MVVRISSEQSDRPTGMDIDGGQSSASSATTTNENLSAQMQEIYETINILASGIQALNDDTQRLSSDSIRLQTSIDSLSQDFQSLKLSIEEQGAFLDGIKPNQEILQQDVASLKQKVDDMQYVSYDGTLIWKISGFREKMSTFRIKCLFI
jgi:predicted  nucleic acid-binding Zn-ribbon protein